MTGKILHIHWDQEKVRMPPGTTSGQKMAQERESEERKKNERQERYDMLLKAAGIRDRVADTMQNSLIRSVAGFIKPADRGNWVTAEYGDPGYIKGGKIIKFGSV